jgi:hypothetical protein
MSLTSTSFTTTFDLTVSPKLFKFTDTTDYATQGITLSWVKSVLTITGPGGAIFYTNSNYSTPDINPSVSLNNAIPILLQLDANGNPIQGAYTVVMTSRVTDGVTTPYDVVKSYSFNYEYSSPTVAINQSVNCVSPLFTSTDETVYTINNVIPTITRNHSLYFPVGSGLSNIIGSTAQTITRGASQFANGTQTTHITTDLLYNFGNSLYVQDSVTGVLEIQVSCEWTCKITCCLKALNNRMESQRCSNYPAFLQTKDIFTQVMGKVTLIMQLISCGQESEVNSIITQIQELANCTDDCCGKDTPSLVTGISGGSGSSAVVEVVSGGSPVSVSSTTAGDTTTYYIDIDSAFVTTVNNSYNTVVANGGGITWTDSGVVNGVRTFTPSVSIVAQDSLAFSVRMTGDPNTYSISITQPYDVEISGSLFQTPTLSFYNAPYDMNNPNGYVISGFYTSASDTKYKIFSELIFVDANPNDGIDMINKNTSYIFPMTIVEKGNTAFTFRFEPPAIDPGNQIFPFKGFAVYEYDVIVNFLITK